MTPLFSGRLRISGLSWVISRQAPRAGQGARARESCTGEMLTLTPDNVCVIVSNDADAGMTALCSILRKPGTRTLPWQLSRWVSNRNIKTYFKLSTTVLCTFHLRRERSFNDNLTFKWVGGWVSMSIYSENRSTIQNDFRVFKKPTFVPLTCYSHSRWPRV